MHFLVLVRVASLVLAFTTALHMGLFGWIEAAARCLDERQRTADLLIFLFIAAMYTLAAVAALRGLISGVELPG